MPSNGIYPSRRAALLIAALILGVLGWYVLTLNTADANHRAFAALAGEAGIGTPFMRAGDLDDLQPSSADRISLNGAWELTYGPQPEVETESSTPSSPSGWTRIPAKVPGNVELDMVAAGKLEDPSVGNRILKLRPLETYQWWYRRTFKPPPWKLGERVDLVLDGLDCFGKIWINGQLVGTTSNMLIPHRFDVTCYLKAGAENEIVVRINSAVLEGRKFNPAPLDLALPGHWESLHVRKASHQYAYDIMPRTISAGLWREVGLEVIKPTHWRSLYWATLKTDPQKRAAKALLFWDFATERHNLDDLQIKVTLQPHPRTSPSGKTAGPEPSLTCKEWKLGEPHTFRDHISLDVWPCATASFPILATHGREEINLTNVDLWWPRGYGGQALYDLTLTLADAHGAALDEQHARIGLRTIELHRSNIVTMEEPGDFTFWVNGERIFIRGTDWVQLDAFHSRDGQFLGAAVDMLVDLNCNLIRCYGGNVYSDRDLLDLCDENGIMVWQEFALGNARYPQDQEFQDVMRHEAEVTVRRLRNHPSLAIWTGGNEIDDASSWSEIGSDPNTDVLTRQVFPQVVQQYDPLRPYLPSSPYHSPELFRHGDRMDMMPEVHLWGPRGYYKSGYYTEVNAHFVSEIGYHGCPNKRSLEQMFDPDYVYPWVKGGQWNDEWLTKSVRWNPESNEYAGRNDLMTKQLKYLFGTVPTGLDDFIAASQITQAEAMKFFIEFWRHDKWRRSGIIWWNLRDGWPILSDAVVDYYNRKKLAYVYIKRVQVNVLAMCGEPVEGQHPVYVVNDTLQPASGHLRIRDADTDGHLLDKDFQVEANAKAAVGQIAAVDKPEMWLIEWQLADGSKFRNHYLAAKPPIRLETYRRWLPKLGLPPEEQWVNLGVDGVE